MTRVLMMIEEIGNGSDTDEVIMIMIVSMMIGS